MPIGAGRVGPEHQRGQMRARHRQLRQRVGKHQMVWASEAMRRAVEALPRPPERLLVDARTIPGLSMPQDPYVKGDGLSFSIAAASIVAKTYRDGLMADLDGAYPGYGFAAHKGYDTPEHRAALARLGPCPEHRMSYRTVRELCGAPGTAG